MLINALILARAYSDYVQPASEKWMFRIGTVLIMAIPVTFVLVFCIRLIGLVVPDIKTIFISLKTCPWCQATFKNKKEMRQSTDGMEFCSLQCKIKYLNEKADLNDRQSTIGKSKNININDRNKFL